MLLCGAMELYHKAIVRVKVLLTTPQETLHACDARPNRTHAWQLPGCWSSACSHCVKTGHIYMSRSAYLVLERQPTCTSNHWLAPCPGCKIQNMYVIEPPTGVHPAKDKYALIWVIKDSTVMGTGCR